MYTKHITLYAGTSYRALCSCNCTYRTCWMLLISFLRHSRRHLSEGNLVHICSLQRGTKSDSCGTQSLKPRMCCCVVVFLHIQAFFLPVDIQHTPCAYWFFLSRDESSVVCAHKTTREIPHRHAVKGVDNNAMPCDHMPSAVARSFTTSRN